MTDRPTKLFTAPLATQRDLYQTRDSKLRECLREEIDAWAKERYPNLDARTMYAEQMSVACEEHVSRATVNNWCSNEGNQLPANKLYGHLVVTGSKRLLEIAIDGSTFSVSNYKESLFAEKGRLELAKKALEKKLFSVEAAIQEQG